MSENILVWIYLPHSGRRIIMKKERKKENYYEEIKWVGELWELGELGDGVSDTFLPFWEFEECVV